MSKPPKGIKGMRRKLLQQTVSTNREMKKAILAAGEAIDAQSQELGAMRRILISERAQVIYYTDKYLACLKKQCVDLVPVSFLELEETVQEPYIKRAIQELAVGEGVVPHEQGAEPPLTVAKKIILPN